MVWTPFCILAQHPAFAQNFCLYGFREEPCMDEPCKVLSSSEMLKSKDARCEGNASLYEFP